MSKPTIVCDVCKEVIPLEAIDLREEMVLFEDGTEIKLMQFKCPSCEAIYPVQLDTKETSEALEEYKIVAMRIANNRKKHRRQPEKQVQRLYKLQAKLKEMRAELVAKYNGSFYQLGDTRCQLEFREPTTNVGKG